MKKLRLLLLGLLVAGIVFWLAGKVGGPPDPKYQGRRLSAVLRNTQATLAPSTFKRIREFAFEEKDVEAIRHMGTNCIPFLLREMNVSNSPLTVWFDSLISKLTFVSIRRRPEWLRHFEAVCAFEVLGPIGEPAIPELAKLLDDGEKGYHAACALGGIGGQAHALLTNALSNLDVRIRANAAVGLGRARSSWPVVVPALLTALGDKSSWVRSSAADSLGEIHQDADLSVPALIKCLEDSDTKVRQDAATALQHFGSAAKPAIPTLLKAREATNSYLYSHYGFTIKAIDPEAAAGAGIR